MINSLGVIFLADKYKVGADLKFKDKNATVICYCKKQQPPREDVLQMVGRGNRSSGLYSGSVFVNKDKHFAKEAKLKMVKRADTDFKDGAINLKVINKVLEAPKISETLK